MSEVTFTFSGKMIPAGLNPTHEDIFGKGGFVALTGDAGSLSDESQITTFLNESIIEQRRKVGMLVYISSLNQYYTCSDTSGSWDRKYFSGRYFYGPSAPTVSDVTIGEKWFNTTVGSEFTYLPTDEDQDTFFWVDIDHLGQGETGFVRISGDVMTGALTTPFVTMTQGFTSSSGFIGTLIANSSSFTSLTASNGFIGTLTGTSSSFTSLTGSNGFIGTLTGTEASFDTIEGSTGVFSFLGIGSDIFSAQDIIDPDAQPIIFGVTGGRNSYFDTNVTIGASGSTSKGWLWVRGGLDESVNSFQVEGNSVFRDDVEIGKDSFYALNFGSTAYQGTQNPNVPVIKSAGGVLIGGNTYAKQNWLGNNALLSPQGHTRIGYPNNAPDDWFVPRSYTDPGGTFPHTLRSLNVSGGIYTDKILEIEPSIISDPDNWVFVAGSVTGDSGIYENALTAANNFAVASISNPSTPGAVFSIGDLYVGRTNVRENSTLRVHGRALKVMGPAEFLDNEYITKEASLTRPLPQTNSNPIVFAQDWEAVTTASDFRFCSLTERKMGFKFPVDVSVRWASGTQSSNGAYSSSWRIKNFFGVYPRNGATTIDIWVDRNLMQPLSGLTPTPVAGYSGNSVTTNTINIAGYLETQTGKRVSCMLSISPSATGPEGV